MISSPCLQTVPDSVRQICELKNPHGNFPKDLFIQAMREITLWHQQHCPWYERYLKQFDIQVNELVNLEKIIELPPIHANFFKYHAIKSIPDEQIALNLSSSGTTGQKSQIFFDAFTIEHARAMVSNALVARGFQSDESANYVLNAYEPFQGFRVGTTNTNQFLMNFAPVAEQFWTLRCTSSHQHEYDRFGAVEILQKYAQSSLPTRIIGFPSFLYFSIQRMRELNMSPLQLPKNSWVVLGGGWKNHVKQEISKQQFVQDIQDWLGIPLENIIETFGSVEHSIPYIACSKQHLHVPVWSRVVIRDVKTLKDIGHGKVGFLSFISPYILSQPAHSIVMGDLASLHPPKSCDCGLESEWFEIHGRAGSSSNKSCAAAAAEVLTQ